MKEKRKFTLFPEKVKWKVVLMRLTFLFAFAFLYSFRAVEWSSYYPSFKLIFLELPILLVIYSVFHFAHKEQTISKRITAEVIPFMVIFICYYYIDFFYKSWLRVPRFSDMKNIPSLVGVWGGIGFIFKALPIIAVLCAIFFTVKSYYQCHSGKNVYKSLACRVSYFFLTIALLISPLAKAYLFKFMSFEEWSDLYNIQQQGRISSMFYYEQKRWDQLGNMKESLGEESIDSLPSAVSVEFDEKPNVYFVLLESFFDPREFQEIKLNGDVIHPKLKKYMAKSGRFDHVKVPVFGAGTAQSEFEILTGVPALEMFDSMEFNSLHGSQTYSICQQFLKNKYSCEAVVATGPNFYNSVEAYKSLQFSHVNYLNEPGSCLQIEDDSEFPADSKVLNTLSDLRKLNGDSPFFGYVVTMFGHRPYKRDLKKMPDVLTALAPKVEKKSLKERINDCVNGVYYKTQYMGEFLDALYEDDPSAVVLLFSDHLPDICFNLEEGIIEKEDAKLHNAPALLLKGGEYEKIEVDTLYQLHHQILTMLSKDDYSLPNEDQLRKSYLHVMAKAVKID